MQCCGSGRIGIILPDLDPHPGPADTDRFQPNVKQKCQYTVENIDNYDTHDADEKDKKILK